MVRWADAAADPAFRDFWSRPLSCVISTVRPDGRPHAALVNALLDVDAARLWVLSRRGSVKVANLRAGSGLVSVTRVDGLYWAGVGGVGRVREEPEIIAEAEQRYALMHRTPQPNPERVIIDVDVRSVVGRWPRPASAAG